MLDNLPMGDLDAWDADEVELERRCYTENIRNETKIMPNNSTHCEGRSINSVLPLFLQYRNPDAAVAQHQRLCQTPEANLYE